MVRAFKLTCLRILAPLGAILLAVPAHSAPTPDDEARFLAGLPVRDTPLDSLSHTSAWAEHAVAFDRAWSELQKRQLQPIDAWSGANLGHFHSSAAPLLYFFSGPDFLYAHAFFPNAAPYVLCGIEPIGPLPRVEDLPPQTLGPSLETLRNSLDSILSFSFFITKKMRTELEDTHLSGTLPILYIFLARSGCRIQDVSFVGLDPAGQFTTGKTRAPGVKIDFARPGAKPQTLYYFSTDLSDDTASRSGFLKWCATLNEPTGFLKAASYLMFTGGFDTTRQFLLGHCAAILQDDSGIPMLYLPDHDWDTKLFGTYAGPINTFKQFREPALDQLMQLQKPAPLPFSVGYRWHPGESSLIFAVRAGHSE